MRIGYDAKRAFFNNSGLGNYSRDAIRVLSKFHASNEYFLYTPRISKNKNISILEDRENIFIRTPFSFLGKIIKPYWRRKNIIKDLIQDEINLYHGLSHEIPIGIEHTKIKSIVTIHDLICIRYPHLFNLVDKKLYLNKIKSSCKRANKIIAISKQTKGDLIKFLSVPAEKIDVVYQGCNKIFQEKSSEERMNTVIKKYNLPERFILSVGKIEERKNLMIILESLSHLPETKLVIIGEGKSYKSKCERFIYKNNLQEQVFFIGEVKSEDISPIYQKAEMFIYPSLFEGFGIPILESLFSRTPVITSKGGCFSETGGKSTIYIDPLSKKELLDAIYQIRNNDDIRNKMIKEGWVHAQKFTDQKVAKNLMNTYESVL